MIEVLKSHRVLICAGTGGVGKTSLSASLAVLAAQNGLRTLVLTIDPALRLAQALGLDTRAGEDVAVPGLSNLWASMIDARKEFDEFVLGSVDSSVARGLFNNKLYQQLVSNLNGSQEFTSLVRLLNAAESGRYDLIVLDTPPTQNAVDFLRAPERLYALFQDSVLGWFAQPEGAHEGFFKRTLSRGTRLVTSALESVTGSPFIAELKDFFSHMLKLQGRVSDVSERVNRLLRASDTGFLLVTGFDESKLKEALEFQKDLAAENLRLVGVLVNRWFPEWSRGETAWSSDPRFAELNKFYSEFAEFFRGRQTQYETFASQVGAGTPVVKLPDYQNNVQGLEDLKRVAETLRQKWEDA